VTIAAGRQSHYGASSTSGGLVIGELCSLGVVEWLILMVLDPRKMRKVEIDIEKSVTGQGGYVAADLEKPLEGNLSAPFLVTCVS
jgi:hypothetical protein